MNYTDLITNYHRGKAKYVEHIDLTTRPQKEIIDLFSEIVTALDLDNATGAQLDILGEWIGRARSINAPIEDYFFTFDKASLGFDLGSWKDRYEPDSGIIKVDDEDYRTMLRAKIGANKWDGSADTLPAILQEIYTKQDINITFTDNQDMTVTVYVTAKNLSTITKEIIKQGYLAIKPAGVTVNYEINGE